MVGIFRIVDLSSSLLLTLTKAHFRIRRCLIPSFSGEDGRNIHGKFTSFLQKIDINVNETEDEL